ncbi:MAG: hypothetical protein K5986_10025, partial [Clostridium sp.]|nr:hypothetical protein [Clostridium sp.]
MKKNKRLISFVLVLAMVVTMLPSTQLVTLAARTPKVKTKIEINPMYKGVVTKKKAEKYFDKEVKKQKREEEKNATASGNAGGKGMRGTGGEYKYIYDPDELVAYVKERFLNRDTSELKVCCDNNIRDSYISDGQYDSDKALQVITDEIFAYDKNNSSAGDYLKSQCPSLRSGAAYQDGKFYFIFQGMFTTTKKQEEALDNWIQQLYARVGLRPATERKYQTATKMYTFIVKNCSYDYAHKDDDTYYDKFSVHNLLTKGVGVCQAVSAAMYKTCLDNGINCRMLSSEGHVWNLIELEDGYWWQCDATYGMRPQGQVKTGWNYTYLFCDKATFDANHETPSPADKNYVKDLEKYNMPEKRYIDWFTENYPGEKQITWATITLDHNTFTYNKKVHKPKVEVVVDGKILDPSTYKVTYETNCKSIGTHTVRVKVEGDRAAIRQEFYIRA